MTRMSIFFFLFLLSVLRTLGRHTKYYFFRYLPLIGREWREELPNLGWETSPSGRQTSSSLGQPHALRQVLRGGLIPIGGIGEGL